MKRKYSPPLTEVEKMCLGSYGILASNTRQDDTFNVNLDETTRGNPLGDIDAKENVSWDIASPWEE